jgi:hypothetical protein
VSSGRTLAETVAYCRRTDESAAEAPGTARPGLAPHRPTDRSSGRRSVPLPRFLVDELARTVVNRPSAAMTLDRYADLFDDDLDDVAERLDALRAAARGQVVDFLRTASAQRRAEDPCVTEETQAKRPVHGSGDEGNRTPNPRLAKAVLCQLSYVP